MVQYIQHLTHRRRQPLAGGVGLAVVNRAC